jgi:CheY-like chemotaxis protein
MPPEHIQSPSPQKVILLVEDEDPFVEKIRSALEAKDFRVAYATSSAQGLDCLNKLSRVDAIWLDHFLEGEAAGLDFLAQARKIPKGLTLPVFVVTNASELEKRADYMKLGVTEYYVKAAQPLEEIIISMENELRKMPNPGQFQNATGISI